MDAVRRYQKVGDMESSLVADRVVGSHTDQVLLELLLEDSEWVDAQFEAIMAASGIGDRPLAGTLSRAVAPTSTNRDTVHGPSRPRSRRLLPVRSSARERSPPR